MARSKQQGFSLQGNHHPLLYEVNARVLVNELARGGKKKSTLASIPDTLIDEWSGFGFNAIWLMGVWSTGKIGMKLARENAALAPEYRRALPDLAEEDISGSPYAVQSYTVSPHLGGEDALASLRSRLAARGIGLILDFVSNHTARDHEWVAKHPEYYVHGKEGEERALPALYFRTKTSKGEAVLAFGRDPTFPGWTDTAQINHFHLGARNALISTLTGIAELCDGVRCDMAMLALRDVFEKTWGPGATLLEGALARGEFWTEAINAVRAKFPGFLFLAEAYWNLEWELQQLGFDFTYDKILYDRLLREGAGSVRDHLKAEMEYQKHSMRFLENHDEQRAARVLPSEPWHCAAALVTSTVPGMVMYHEGEFDGRTIKLPVQLSRRPAEPCSPQLHAFYERLLGCLRDPVFRGGDWRLLSTRPAWHENFTWQNFLVFWWHAPGAGARLVVVNYAPLSGQCYVDFPLDMLEGTPMEFKDLLSDAAYVRDRVALSARGMYFDLPGYGVHLFEVTAGRKSSR